MGPTGNSRIVQIHPTRRCNLRCLHCYSLSGPDARDELPEAVVRLAIDDAKAEGFNVTGFSGGEPTMYEPLFRLLEHAKHLGLITTVTSNGMLLNSKKTSALAGVLDLLAISLDGVPEAHNRMRDNNRAFEKMDANLQSVRDCGIAFGFIFTLTQYNLSELDWIVDYSLEQGAQLLQIHPLAEVGRAEQLLTGARPDDVEMAYSLLAAARAQKQAGQRLYVQLDLVNVEELPSRATQVFAGDSMSSNSRLPLAELVSPLIIEPDGSVVPLQFGFPRFYGLGNLYQSRLSKLARSWQQLNHQNFLRLCRVVLEELTSSARELPMANWYECVSERAKRPLPTS